MILLDFIKNLEKKFLKSLTQYYTHIGNVQEITLLKSSPNFVFKIKANKIYIAKIYNSSCFLELQYDYLNYLNNFFTVQNFIFNDCNKLTSHIDIQEKQYYLALKEYIYGDKFIPQDIYSLYILGENLATLHSHIANYIPPVNTQLPMQTTVDNEVEKIKSYLSENRISDCIFRLNQLKVLLNSKCFNLDGIPSYLLHGDLGFSNLLIDKNKIAYIDFDNLCFNNIYFDLGQIYWNVKILGLEPEIWSAFESGYKSCDDLLFSSDNKLLMYYSIYHELKTINYYLEITKTQGRIFFRKDFISNRLNFIENTLLEELSYR